MVSHIEVENIEISIELEDITSVDKRELFDDYLGEQLLNALGFDIDWNGADPANFWFVRPTYFISGHNQNIVRLKITGIIDNDYLKTYREELISRNEILSDAIAPYYTTNT